MVAWRDGLVCHAMEATIILIINLRKMSTDRKRLGYKQKKRDRTRKEKEEENNTRDREREIQNERGKMERRGRREPAG